MLCFEDFVKSLLRFPLGLCQRFETIPMWIPL